MKTHHGAFALAALVAACGGEAREARPTHPTEVRDPAPATEDVAAPEPDPEPEDDAVRAPFEVAAITDAVEVVAGFDHTCVRHATGSVSCWGAGHAQQLGPGVAASARPVTVTGVEGAVELYAGAAHTCARRDDGRVVCWGDNRFAQLGSGGPEAHGPLVVPAISARALGGGRTTTCAVEARGVRCWGRTLGRDYALGGGLVDPRERMARVRRATRVGLGEGYGCLLDDGGRVSCWGQNEYGQLGRATDGDGYDDAPPAAVTGLPRAAEVAVSPTHACARAIDGEVFCWGFDSVGETSSDEPGLAHVPDVHHAAQIAVTRALSCARIEDGRVSCWGSNVFGELGTTDQDDAGPSFVPGIDDATDLAVGDEHVCVVHRTGRVACWGHNPCGEIGQAPVAGAECEDRLDEPAGREGDGHGMGLVFD